MLNYIDTLRSKPPAIRRRYALIASSGIALLIAFFWIVSITKSFNGNTTIPDDSTPSPLESISKNFSEGYGDIMNQNAAAVIDAEDEISLEETPTEPAPTEPVPTSASTNFGEVIITDPE
jgi:hypothetical protein